jgi:hypothetical protein
MPDHWPSRIWYQNGLFLIVVYLSLHSAIYVRIDPYRAEVFPLKARLGFPHQIFGQQGSAKDSGNGAVGMILFLDVICEY